MDETTRAAREEVIRARAALSGEVDELGSAARSSLDIPGKVRREPVKTVGIAAGAAFLAVNGPKRVLRAVENRLRGGKPPPPKSLLPKDVEKAIDRLGEDGPYVKARLEREFARYLEEKSKAGKMEAGGRQSLWRLFDAVAVPLGAQASRRLTERLLAADPDRPAVPAVEEKASGTEALLEDAAVVAATDSSQER
jgi:hypothetical protein